LSSASLLLSLHDALPIFDLKSGALLARNFYNTEFPDRIVFLDVNEPTRTLTGDRKEFLGRNGTLAQPAALKRASRCAREIPSGRSEEHTSELQSRENLVC